MAKIKADVYRENTLVSSTQLNTDANGRVELGIPDGTLSPSLIPYTVIFTDLDVQKGNFITVQHYSITPVILNAMTELRTYLDRMNTQLRLDSLHFADEDYLTMLKGGMDLYNVLGRSTDINMTAARGPIYGFWMICSQLVALRTKYLEEGLTSFDYQGAGIQLSVEVTQFIEAQSSFLEAQLDKAIDNHKALLHKKGTTTGDGSNWKGSVQGATGYSNSPLIWGGNLLGGSDHPNKTIQ